MKDCQQNHLRLKLPYIQTYLMPIYEFHCIKPIYVIPWKGLISFFIGYGKLKKNNHPLSSHQILQGLNQGRLVHIKCTWKKIYERKKEKK